MALVQWINICWKCDWEPAGSYLSARLLWGFKICIIKHLWDLSSLLLSLLLLMFLQAMPENSPAGTFSLVRMLITSPHNSREGFGEHFYFNHLTQPEWVHSQPKSSAICFLHISFLSGVFSALFPWAPSYPSGLASAAQTASCEHTALLSYPPKCHSMSSCSPVPRRQAGDTAPFCPRGRVFGHTQLWQDWRLQSLVGNKTKSSAKAGSD